MDDASEHVADSILPSSSDDEYDFCPENMYGVLNQWSWVSLGDKLVSDRILFDGIFQTFRGGAR